MKSNTNYILVNMAASSRIMLGNLQGLEEIDQSASGFWRSFIALILAAPFALSSKYAEYTQVVKSTIVEHPVPLISYLFIQETASLLAYFLSLFVLFAICKSLKIIEKFPTSVVALNWSSMTMKIVSFPALVFMGMMDNRNAILPFLVLLLMAVFSFAMFNVLRLSLNIPPRSAIVCVFVLSVFEIIAYFMLLDVAGI